MESRKREEELKEDVVLLASFIPLSTALREVKMVEWIHKSLYPCYRDTPFTPEHRPSLLIFHQAQKEHISTMFTPVGNNVPCNRDHIPGFCGFHLSPILTLDPI